MLCGFLLLLLETGHFEYYDVVTLEIRFSPVPGDLLLFLSKVIVVHVVTSSSLFVTTVFLVVSGH